MRKRGLLALQLPWNLPNDRSRIKWDGAVILGGLECIVQTYFPASDFRLSEFNILDAHCDEHLPNVWAGTLKAHCRRLLGQGDDHQRSWDQEHAIFQIFHDNRFVEAY